MQTVHGEYFQSRHPYWLTPNGWAALTEGFPKEALQGADACENPDQRVTAE